jgi:hypothetical protein
VQEFAEGADQYPEGQMMHDVAGDDANDPVTSVTFWRIVIAVLRCKTNMSNRDKFIDAHQHDKQRTKFDCFVICCQLGTEYKLSTIQPLLDKSLRRKKNVISQMDKEVACNTWGTRHTQFRY